MVASPGLNETKGDYNYNCNTVQHAPAPFYWCPFTIKNEAIELEHLALIDPGANCNIIASSFLPPSTRALYKTPPSGVEGIGKGRKTIGQFKASAESGTIKEELKFLIMDNPSVPLLIGQDLTRHKSVDKVLFDNRAGVLELRRSRNGNKSVEKTTFKVYTAEKIPQDKSGLGNKGPDEDNLAEIKEEAGKSEPLDVFEQLEMNIECFSDDEKRRVMELAKKHKELFGPETKLFPREVEIPTTGAPKANKQHSIPLKHRPLVDAEIETMFRNGIIEECNDPKGWRSPILTVDKPDGSLRVCVNFKGTLNQRLADEEVYSQCPADELFARIRPGNKYFAALDLKKGYWQIPLEESDRHKTCFQWGNKTYQFTRLPFGLKTAGSIFCRAIAKALNSADFDEDHTHVYLDDISVMAPKFDEFLAAMEKVFIGLQKFNLRLAPKKCKLLAPSIKYLGRKISSDRIEPDQEYIAGIWAMKPPKTKRQLQSLIGQLVWLRTFIGAKMGNRVALESFSHHMAPIHECNREKKFQWTEAADKAFDKIKKKLTMKPFLSFYEPGLPIVLSTDASDYAAGAVLMQRASHDDYRVVGMISKTFNKTEQRWSCTEKEAYAIKWAVEKFDYFLARQHFTVMSDHRALLYIDKTDFKNQKVSRWQDFLSSYSFTVQYIEGESNCFADWLSRGCERDERNERTEKDFKPAGKFHKVVLNGNDTGLRVYVPSWVGHCLTDENGKMTLVPYGEEGVVNHNRLIVFDENERDRRIMGPSAFVARRQSSEQYELFSHFSIIESQQLDPFYAKVVSALNRSYKNDEEKRAEIINAIDKNDHRAGKFTTEAAKLFLDIGSGMLCRQGPKCKQIMVPETLIKNYLFTAHNGLAHAGQDRMEQYLSTFWWPGKKSDIEEYTRTCENCARVKGNHGKRKVKSGTNEKGTFPFEKVFIDFVSMPPANGYRYILTMVCSFTRFVVAYPLRSCSASATAKCMIDFIAQFRKIPSVISSDRGTHFTGAVFRETLAGLNIAQKLHVAWRPQSSGVLERQHRTLKVALHIASKEKNGPWHESLKLVVSAMNATFNTATKCSPHKAVYGDDGLLGLPDLNQMKAESAPEYALLANATLRDIHTFVRLANETTDQKYLTKENSGQLRPSLRKGDKCCLYRPVAADATKKEPWIGQFTVLEAEMGVAKVKCDKTGKCDWVSHHHLRRLDVRPEKLTIEDDWIDLYEPVIVKAALPVESREERQGSAPQKTREEIMTPPIASDSPPEAAPRPRRSGRKSVPPVRLNIKSTKTKSYSEVLTDT